MATATNCKPILPADSVLEDVLGDRFGADFEVTCHRVGPWADSGNGGGGLYERRHDFTVNWSKEGREVEMVWFYMQRIGPNDVSHTLEQRLNRRGLHLKDEPGRVRQALRGHWKPLFGIRTPKQLDAALRRQAN